MSKLLTSSPPPLSDRFRSTAEHYVRGRLPYPSDLIELVAKRVGLETESRVLDLGCGPGFLAVEFSRHATEVIGIDPEPAMLAVARRYALEKHTHVFFQQGSSEELDSRLGRFRLTTMGRSFHWMDRVATLRALDDLTESGGAVALFRDRHLELPENFWKKGFDDLFEDLRANDPDRNIDRRSGRQDNPHEAVLLESAFSHLERIAVIRRLNTPVDHLIDRALSFSIASPDRLGADRNSFLDRLRSFLIREASDGFITEIVETEALLAFRPKK